MVISIIIFTFSHFLGGFMNRNEVKERGTPDFPFELYKVDRAHPRYEMAMHWHGDTEFIRVISGGLTIILDNRHYMARAGDVFVVNPETMHGAIPRDSVYECIVFRLDFLRTGNSECDAFIDSLTGGSTLIDEQLPEGDARRAVIAMFDALRERGDGYRFRVIASLMTLLAAVREDGLYSSADERKNERDEKNVHKLKRAVAYIREKYNEEITLEDIAASTGFSTKYFCSFFRRMTDKTPIEYLNSYRIEKAARRLLSTDDSVTEIAYSTGFNDLSYFIKTFKAVKGTTPNAYRKTGKST